MLQKIKVDRWFINEAIRQRNLSNPNFDISGDGFQVRDIYIDDLMSLCTKNS